MEIIYFNDHLLFGRERMENRLRLTRRQSVLLVVLVVALGLLISAIAIYRPLPPLPFP